jgi:hypothetical protein
VLVERNRDIVGNKMPVAQHKLLLLNDIQFY